MNSREFLIALASKLDEEGNIEKADLIDENFEEFLKLLEDGKLVFDFTHYMGWRDPRKPYSSPGGIQMTLSDIPGPI